jgi:hypothetical protein
MKVSLFFSCHGFRNDAETVGPLGDSASIEELRTLQRLRTIADS